MGGRNQGKHAVFGDFRAIHRCWLFCRGQNLENASAYENTYCGEDRHTDRYTDGQRALRQKRIVRVGHGCVFLNRSKCGGSVPPVSMIGGQQG